MNRPLAILLFALPLLAQAPNLDKLPAWAAAEARASLAQAPAADAEAWVLLQKSRFAYTGSGEIRKETRRLVRVLGERGLGQAVFAVFGLGGKTSTVKHVKGWNLRPDGELTSLDTSNPATFSPSGTGAAFITGMTTTAALARVVKGSYVAFESQELITHPLGPVAETAVLEPFPIRRWELELATDGGWFFSRPLPNVKLKLETRNLAPWTRDPETGPARVVLRDLPARPRDEGLRPAQEDCEPCVYAAFLDPEHRTGPSLVSWDAYAGWVARAYAERAVRIEPLPLAGLAPAAGLAALADWMSRELTYKQLYLSPERGWVPETSAEVCRRRYGDCKDLASCLMGGAVALGLHACPVLAQIHGGHLPPDHPVTPFAFNHVICAIKLEASLGLPAEVETTSGRFLLVDPTSRLTPFGFLPDSHRGRRVLICFEDKGLWVRVADPAIEPAALELHLTGQVGLDGRLEATLAVREAGDRAGLRAHALFGQKQAFQEHLRGILGLRGDARLELQEVSDPLALAKPLTLRARLVWPGALATGLEERVLAPIGLPPIPPAAQRTGHPRLYPVETLADSPWTWELDLDLPAELAPRVLDRRLETPFRSASWKAEWTGGHLHGLFRATAKAAEFGFDRREDGVREARQDRNQLKALEEDVLSFGAAKAARP